MTDRIDLKLGFACNNRCVFCVQGDKRERFKPFSLEDLTAKLAEGRRDGVASLVVTGGEPTMHPEALEVVRRARAQGYTTVQLQTNGRIFAYPEACRRYRDAGVTEFCPSVHGSDAAMHDALTAAPGSFLQTVAGIRNLRALGALVMTNTVITRRNARDLPAVARLLASLGVAQSQFAFVHILGEAAAGADAVVPRKSEVQPFLLDALAVLRAAGVRAMTEAIPPCLLPGFEDCAAEWVMPATLVFDAEATIDYVRYRKTEGKGLGPRCGECRWARRCEGPWREYPLQFGWDEFVPVR